jgi:hypothetical protein
MKAENGSNTSGTKLDVHTYMTFKVIITRPSVDDDENTYYGISMLRDGQIKSGRLEYSASDNKLKVTLTYDGNPIKVGEKFLAILVPVNESEIDNSTTPEFKIHENTPANAPEVVNF